MKRILNHQDFQNWLTALLIRIFLFLDIKMPLQLERLH